MTPSRFFGSQYLTYSSELQYTGEDFKWGFQIADYDQRHQWFKLGLDPEQCNGASSTLARDYPDTHASPPEYDHSPEKLVTDYLTALRKHAEQVLRHKLPESALTSTPIEFVITTPAVWVRIADFLRFPFCYFMIRHEINVSNSRNIPYSSILIWFREC